MADFVTLGNAACGTCSIFFCLNYLENNQHQPYIVAAFALLPLALIFDIMDGFVARARQNSSPYGSDLDSLADVISFAVAPAVLGFTLGLRGMWDCGILSFFVCCGVSRLARYNVTAESLADASTGKVKHYQGFPVPTSLFLVMVLGIAYYYGESDEGLWSGEGEEAGEGCTPRESRASSLTRSPLSHSFVPPPPLALLPPSDGVLGNMFGGVYRLSFPSSLPGHFHPFSLLFFFFGCAMISEWPIPKP
jgi:CDP-diacylglycerol--serine O-phosphatidyltransferase